MEPIPNFKTISVKNTDFGSKTISFTTSYVDKDEILSVLKPLNDVCCSLQFPDYALHDLI